MLYIHVFKQNAYSDTHHLHLKPPFVKRSTFNYIFLRGLNNVLLGLGVAKSCGSGLRMEANHSKPHFSN